jgi:glycosyltransferase involved in cell wall biosynthesis
MTISYSIIIPAYDEEKWMPATLNALQKAMKAIDMTGEGIVADNNAQDGTAAIAREHGAVVVFEPVNQISRARNAGAKAARGRYLIFLDADTVLSTALLQKALNNLSSGSCCGGGGKVVYEGALPGVVRVATDLWNYFSVKFGMAAGCFVYCLKEAFDAVGGFSQNVYASEEIWFSWKLRAWGKQRHMDFRIISDPPLITSSRKLKWFSLPGMFGMLMVFSFFPFAVRYRPLCRLWYERPVDEKEKIIRQDNQSGDTPGAGLSSAEKTGKP